MNQAQFNQAIAEAGDLLDALPEVVERAHIDEINGLATKLRMQIDAMRQVDAQMGDVFARAKADAAFYKEVYYALLNKVLDRVGGDY